MDEAVLSLIITAAVLLLVVLKVAALYCLYLKVVKPKQAKLLIRVPSHAAGFPSLPANHQRSGSFTTLAPPDSIFLDATNHEKRFNLQQVITMTDNFKNQLGRGGFGSVYYGTMTDAKAVAVKRLSSESHQGPVQFQNEVDILLRVHHRNLVSLVGYCKEFQERILIYEYIRGGALDEHLHRHESCANKPVLGWETRIRIAVNVANGLKYLHADCDPKIIHRDVKASNILLDENFTAKVADFGLSKSFPEQSVTHVSTAVQGTIGYMDPEYANGLGSLTDKSDVYSFGIVLLELLTGCRPILGTPSGVQHISEWARPYILDNKVNEIADKSLEDDCNMEVLKAVALVALKCLEPKGIARPSMSEVLEELELIAKTHLKRRATLETKKINVASLMQSLESCPSPLAHTCMTRPIMWDISDQQHDFLSMQHSY